MIRRPPRSTRTAPLFPTRRSSDLATPYPYRLQCEQFKLSRLLSARLDAHPHGRSLFQRRILGIAQDADGVTVSVESPLAIEQYRADYVIAADGANSTIRKWLDIEFEGFTYPERFRSEEHTLNSSH